MGSFTIKLPDVGEGVAEAELVEWHVKVGDPVREDMVLAAVMTDKATVDIPSPVEGTVAWIGGEVGETIAVGSPLVRVDVAGSDDAEKPSEYPPKTPEKATDFRPDDVVHPIHEEATANALEGPSSAEDKPANKGSAEAGLPAPVKEAPRVARPPLPAATARKAGEKPLASPAVRRRAVEAGIDLRRVSGSGPAGRITAEDLQAYVEGGDRNAAGRGLVADQSVTDIRIVGLRRRIAEKMALAKSRIAHITYVDEIDMQALEDLRASLNASRRGDRPKLTIIPFLMRALVVAIRDNPKMNAHYDDEAGVLHQYGGVHIGIAAQTGQGLVVPVVRHVEALDLWGAAGEAARLAEAAKAGGAKRDELSGSTITITSLGALGGIATTPMINHPEVAIVGVNKLEIRPVWNGSAFLPRKRMNLSSSFDHRVIDGYDAAIFIQRVKTLLENPAMIFIEE